jgi:protein-tyrosine phosphatase
MSPESSRQISVLFVCMGNICRSPMAEGAFQKCLQDSKPGISVRVDSAGTHGYHTDAPPDPRAQTAAARRGIDISSLQARRVVDEDFASFDHILAMDQDNHEWLIARAPVEHHDKIKLFLEFSASIARANVPDPYYGPASGFERVLDLVQEGAKNLLWALVEESRRR